MSAVASILNRDGSPVEQTALLNMVAARPERGPDGYEVWCHGAVGLCHQHFWLTPEEQGEQQPLHRDGLFLVADIRLDNRSELQQHLQLPSERMSSISDAQLLLDAYERWAEACAEHLLGDFVFVLWDSPRQQLVAARDPLGVYSLSVYVDRQRCLIASEPLAILTQLDSTNRLDDNRIGAFLANLDVGHDETFFRGIRYLPPGHTLVVSADSLRESRYWDLEPQHRIRYRTNEQYVEHYYSLLSEAVSSRLRVAGPIGVSMSGGLDSTSVAALAAATIGHKRRTGNGQLRSFSYAFDELDTCDEREYIQPVVAQANLNPTYLLCDNKWPLRDMDTWPLSKDYVLADPFASLPATVMEAAGKSGVRMLLTGYYGDVLFTGGHYWALDLLREGRIGELTRLSMTHRRSFLWQDAYVEYGLRRLIPDGMRLTYRKFRPRAPETTLPGLGQSLIDRTDLSERFVAVEPSAGQWAPGQWQRYKSLFHSADSQGPGAVRYQYNRHGVELSLPYNDRRLVEFVMAVPAYILGGPDYDRKLHREALKGLLPEAVRLRRIPTSFAPLMLRGLQEREWGKVQTIMENPLVVERGYINGDWLAGRLEKGYDLSVESGLLWRSLCLEMWLKRYWS